MNGQEARQIVEAGLKQKRIQREKRAAELENQERILRLTINDNHRARTIEDAWKNQKRMEADRKKQEDRAKKRAAWAKERAERVVREQKAVKACNNYLITCLVIWLASMVTRLNIFVAIALILGLAPFPAAYIFRLYYPIEEVK